MRIKKESSPHGISDLYELYGAQKILRDFILRYHQEPCLEETIIYIKKALLIVNHAAQKKREKIRNFRTNLHT